MATYILPDFSTSPTVFLLYFSYSTWNIFYSRAECIINEGVNLLHGINVPYSPRSMVPCISGRCDIC